MQTLLPRPEKFDFMTELVKSFLAANIPLHKLENEHIGNLFKKMGYPCPSVRTCREKVDKLAEAEQAQVKDLMKDKQIFLMVDESEIRKKKFCNTLVGKIDNPAKTYLLKCEVMDVVNQFTMAQSVDDTLRLLEGKI